MSLSLMALLLQSAPPAVPSFDCAAATRRVDRAICADPALTRSDRTMAMLFARARVSSFGQELSGQLAAQRAWLRERDADCAQSPAAKISTCIKGHQDQRNLDLAAATLMRDPATALAVYRQLAPQSAPLMEAIALYAAEPDNSRWDRPALADKRSRLIGLLTPYWQRLQGDDGLSFPRSILNDQGVKTIDDALKDQKHFADFLRIASVSVANDAGLTLPCDVAVRHPALLEATDAVFGSSWDNAIINSDCAVMTPPMPAFAAMVDRLNKGWPQCEGTIRFAYYRNYRIAQDRARLGYRDQAQKPDAQWPQSPDISAAMMRRAVSELADSYRRHRRSETPDVMARAAINAMIAARQCD